MAIFTKIVILFWFMNCLNNHESGSSNVRFVPFIRLSMKNKIIFFKDEEITIRKISKDKVL